MPSIPLFLNAPDDFEIVVVDPEQKAISFTSSGAQKIRAHFGLEEGEPIDVSIGIRDDERSLLILRDERTMN